MNKRKDTFDINDANLDMRYITPRKTTSKDAKDPERITSYIVIIHLPDKKHYIKSFSVKDYKTKELCLKDAIYDRDRILHDIENGKYIPVKPKIPTVDEVYNNIPLFKWGEYSSREKYKKLYRKWISNQHGHQKITAITEDMISEDLMYMAETCVQQHVGNLKTLWKKIMQQAYTMKIPVNFHIDLVQMPKCDHATTRSLNEQNIREDDFQDFCKFMSSYGRYRKFQKDSIYKRDIILYALRLNRYLGLRPQELMAIRRSRLDFGILRSNGEESELCKIFIVRSIGSTSTQKVAEKNLKKACSRRYVLVPSEALPLLNEILAYSKYDLIFSKPDGTPFTSSEVSTFLYCVNKSWHRQMSENDRRQKVFVYAGLMRKSYASDCYQQGINPAAIMASMGHSKMSTSINEYATVASDDAMLATTRRIFKGEEGENVRWISKNQQSAQQDENNF